MFATRLSGVAALLALGLFGSTAWAQTTLDINIDTTKAEQYGLDPDALQSELATAIDGAVKPFDQTGFLRSMANAAGVAGKGMGADYASNVKKAVAGFSVGTGANANGLTLGRGESLLPEAGFSGQASAMAGLNLGGLGGDPDQPGFWDHWVIYVHGMGYSGSPSREFAGSMYNFGGAVQLKPILPISDGGLFEWGAFDITAGIQQSHYQLVLGQTLPIGDAGSLLWDASGSYVIDVNTTSVPIELSTNLRVSVVTVFVGGALDLHVGEAASIASLGGPITASANGETVELGTADLSLAYNAGADPMTARVFFGPQVNLFAFKAYVHFNIAMAVSPTTTVDVLDPAANRSAGMHAGFRLAF